MLNRPQKESLTKDKDEAGERVANCTTTFTTFLLLDVLPVQSTRFVVG